MSLAAAGGHVHKFLLIHTPHVVSFAGLEHRASLSAECPGRGRSVSLQRLLASRPQRRGKSTDNLGADF